MRTTVGKFKDFFSAQISVKRRELIGRRLADAEHSETTEREFDSNGESGQQYELETGHGTGRDDICVSNGGHRADCPAIRRF